VVRLMLEVIGYPVCRVPLFFRGGWPIEIGQLSGGKLLGTPSSPQNVSLCSLSCS
jgi:hypothetical protein